MVQSHRRRLFVYAPSRLPQTTDAETPLSVNSLGIPQFTDSEGSLGVGGLGISQFTDGEGMLSVGGLGK